MIQIKTIQITIFLFTFLLAKSQTSTNNYPYKSGEKLKYEVSYGFITGAKAEVELKEVTYEGKKVLHTRAAAYTIGLVDKLFYVLDIYESYFDIETCKPYRAICNIREGKYIRYYDDYFDHDKLIVKNKEKGEVKITDKTYDVVSAYYFLRRMNIANIKVGDILRVKTYFHNDPFDVIIRFKGYETIKTKFGKILCYKFKPVVEKGIFEDEDALSIWISKDENLIPIKVQMSLFIGSFKTELVEYSGLKKDLNFIKK